MNISDMKVLICDDSILVRKKLIQHLSSLGCENIFEAIDGEEAVKTFELTKPDLTFMDIVMPKKTGVEALKDIMSKHPKAKIIMASSVGTQNHLKIAIEAGAYDFLQKPIDYNIVTRILEKISKED